jgi:hypothetical protein
MISTVYTYRKRVQNQSLCHIAPDRAGPHWALNFFSRSPNLNVPNEAKKDAATVESNTVQTWHKSASWLISAATVLGLIVIFQT